MVTFVGWLVLVLMVLTLFAGIKNKPVFEAITTFTVRLLIILLAVNAIWGL